VLLTFPARCLLIALADGRTVLGFYPDIAAASAYVLALVVQTAYSSFRHAPGKACRPLTLILPDASVLRVGVLARVVYEARQGGAGSAREVVLETISV